SRAEHADFVGLTFFTGGVFLFVDGGFFFDVLSGDFLDELLLVFDGFGEFFVVCALPSFEDFDPSPSGLTTVIPVSVSEAFEVPVPVSVAVSVAVTIFVTVGRVVLSAEP